VGLKLWAVVALIVGISGSNRTIVGLKLKVRLSTSISFAQQSHHCGIETERRSEQDVEAFGSNRTIVGLKHGNGMPTGNGMPQQQSHHCGIETKQREKLLSQVVLQQSHHCGIET